jgi:hypothetical protein
MLFMQIALHDDYSQCRISKFTIPQKTLQSYLFMLKNEIALHIFLINNHRLFICIILASTRQLCSTLITK